MALSLGESQEGYEFGWRVCFLLLKCSDGFLLGLSNERLFCFSELAQKPPVEIPGQLSVADFVASDLCEDPTNGRIASCFGLMSGEAGCPVGRGRRDDFMNGVRAQTTDEG